MCLSFEGIFCWKSSSNSSRYPDSDAGNRTNNTVFEDLFLHSWAFGSQDIRRGFLAVGFVEDWVWVSVEVFTVYFSRLFCSMIYRLYLNGQVCHQNFFTGGKFRNGKHRSVVLVKNEFGSLLKSWLFARFGSPVFRFVAFGIHGLIQ